MLRAKLTNRIAEEWHRGREEGFQAACHKMGWECQQDYDYQSHGPILFSVRTSKDLYVIEQGRWTEDIDIVVSLMSDDVLLDFWEAQLCLKYR